MRLGVVQAVAAELVAGIVIPPQASGLGGIAVSLEARETAHKGAVIKGVFATGHRRHRHEPEYHPPCLLTGPTWRHEAVSSDRGLAQPAQRRLQARPARSR